MGSIQRARQFKEQPTRGLWRVLFGAALLPFFLPSVAAAATPISQQYLADSKMSLGSVVSLREASSQYVDAATTDNTSNLIGIVISQDGSPISLSSNQPNAVQVTTSGIAPVLVSDINGSVLGGDPITSSPISGVGMKATGNTKVVGIAQGDLAKSTHTEKQTYTDKAGAKHTIVIGQIPVLVSVSYYYKQPDKSIIPPALQNLANALAGKAVNPVPIIISAAIFLIMLLVVVTLIYTMIHSSIISIGRNPLSQAAVYRNLIQLSGLIIIIMGVSVVAMYLVLTKF